MSPQCISLPFLESHRRVVGSLRPPFCCANCSAANFNRNLADKRLRELLIIKSSRHPSSSSALNSRPWCSSAISTLGLLPLAGSLLVPIQSIVSDSRIQELGLPSLSRMTVSGSLYVIGWPNTSIVVGLIYPPQIMTPHRLSAITLTLQRDIHSFPPWDMEHEGLVRYRRRLRRSARTSRVQEW